jgi:hypothetical protein
MGSMRSLPVIGLGVWLVAGSGLAVADPISDLRALQVEVHRRDAGRAAIEARRRRLETESQSLAGEVDREKERPAGIARDRRLQDLLALARAKADELEHVSLELRAHDQATASVRKRIIDGCDRALKQGPQVSESARLELQRLRTAAVAQLVLPAQPLSVAGRGAAPAAGAADPLDGPRELQEKADLLRDSEDKLRREVRRLAERIDNVERRSHLRERARDVDEDWFGESFSARQVARAATTASASQHGEAKTAGDADTRGANSPTSPPQSPAASPSPGTPTVSTPSAPSGGSTGSNGLTGSGSFAAPQASADAVVLRNLVDPATLDELRRTDGGDDLERQARALRRAQGELESLANELNRRARTLSDRAAELKHRK